MKKKVLATSLLTIALCISVICGATLAIFTSESKTNIAIETGKVEVVATVDNIKTYSNGKEMPENKFENGGSVAYEDGEFIINRITPGDKVTFDINIENNSNIAILYKVGYTMDEGALKDALIINLGEDNTANSWQKVPVDGEIGSVSASIELPFEASGVQGQTANIAVKVEAVQANANVADSEESLKDNIANAEPGDTIALISDIALDSELNLSGVNDIIIDGNGHRLTTKDDTKAVIGENGQAAANIVIRNAIIDAGKYWGSVIVTGVRFENCVFNGGNVYITPTAANNTAVFENCTFNGSMLMLDYMNTVIRDTDTPIDGTLNVIVKNNVFNVKTKYDSSKLHTGVGVAMFIREDSGFYQDVATSKAQLTMSGNNFVNETGNDTFCAYQIIQTWDGSLTESSTLPQFADNTFAAGARYSWANYNPWTAWDAAIK